MYDIFYVSKTNGNDTDWMAIKSKYPFAQRLTYITSYEAIKTKAFTKLFWVIWDDIDLDNTFDLTDYKVTKWDQEYVHIFKNGDYFDGICLFPKSLNISQREFNNRFFIAKKEIDIIASVPKKYKIYSPTTFLEYQSITDDMFWVVWPEIEIVDNSVFDLHFNHHNIYDRSENHVFNNLCNNTESFLNGIVLFSKNKMISKKEFDRRYLIEKKEYSRVVSKHRLYDVVFISYNESNAEENYTKLIVKCPRAKRVHGVKGIHQAHIQAASICDTDMIWIVDGDAVIEDDFNFDLSVSSYDTDCVHVWRSRNPINDLEYGNGGVKLLPRQLTLAVDIGTPDMTTSISKKFKVMQSVSNTNAFNTDEFSTWRSAFRECAKLASQTIQRHLEEETTARLNTWCTVARGNYSNAALDGATRGRKYGEENKNNQSLLSKINDFDWLKTQFEEANE